ncbi:MAG: DNA/RNA nuclease SfsA [Pseudomonadota bacterium]
MDLPSPLSRGTLQKRYKRFLADVTLDTGEEVTAHVPNPGAMMGLKTPGFGVWLSRSTNPKRKLPLTLELVEADNVLVGVNTSRPNDLAAEAIAAGRIAGLPSDAPMRREVRYGENSRIDILLEPAGAPPIYVEVKNVHLMRQPGLAEFPDCVTTRGAKHLRELAMMRSEGARTVMLYVVQRPDCDRFSLACDIDPGYAQAFATARSAGVEALCYGCRVAIDEIVLEHRLEIAVPAGT